VQLIFLLRFLAGASFAGPLFGANLSLWAGAAVWVCVTLSVYVFNGAMDIEEDRVNGSQRPVARGALTVPQAVGAAVGLAALALAGGMLLAGPLVWCVAAALALGWSYSGPPLYLKRYPAGLAITATLGGLLTYFAGYTANGGTGIHHNLVVFAGALSLWMGLVGQTKDLSDAEGDEQAGRRSGPVAWGEGTARLVYSALALFVGGAFMLWAAISATELLLAAIVLMVGASIVAILLLGPWSRGRGSKLRKPYRAFMATQYAVHLIIIV
jgi:4-hydroxybenzoate polyprenyltransferase